MELEKALEVAHSRVTSEPHPLLASGGVKRKALAKRKKDQNGHGHGDDEENEDSEEGEFLEEALGTLNIDDEGRRARYFGRSACVEVCLRFLAGLFLAEPSCSVYSG